MRPMRYPLLALLALPLLAASCGDQGTKLPDDPVALAQALGEFGLDKGFYGSDDPEAQAEATLEESEERLAGRPAVEERTSDEATPPT